MMLFGRSSKKRAQAEEREPPKSEHGLREQLELVRIEREYAQRWTRQTCNWTPVGGVALHLISMELRISD